MRFVSVSIAILCSCQPRGDDNDGRARFDPHSTTYVVDHLHYTLVPGTTHQFLDREDPQSAVVTSQVSHFPGTVAGIPVTVVLSRRFQFGEMTEERFEYFVQDSRDNVWILGADVAQYHQDDITGHEGSWRFDVARARAGLVLSGKNVLGQTYLRRTEDGDRRVEVTALDALVTLGELGLFKSCLRLLETGAAREPLIRYFAPETGPILVENTQGIATLELLEIRDDRLPRIQPAEFIEQVDHPLLPLPVGRMLLYAGHEEDGYLEIEVCVLDERRQIAGVDCTTVRERTFVEGALAEESLHWYAQDIRGNVWHFGEEEGSDPADHWIAGVDGAQPGIEMIALPRVGDSYRQEYAAGIAEDLAIVTSLEAAVSTDLGEFTCLEVIEENPLEPDSANEFKYFAAGIGLVLETNSANTERVSLVEIR